MDKDAEDEEMSRQERDDPQYEKASTYLNDCLASGWSSNDFGELAGLMDKEWLGGDYSERQYLHTHVVNSLYAINHGWPIDYELMRTMLTRLVELQKASKR